MTWIHSATLLGWLVGTCAAGQPVHAVDWPAVRALKPIDRSSPQKAAAALRRSFSTRNWRRTFRTITPESQETMIGGRGNDTMNGGAGEDSAINGETMINVP